MSRQDQEKNMIDSISNHCGTPALEISLNSDLRTDLQMDEIEMNELLGSLEEEFDIDIPSNHEVLQSLVTVNDLISLVIDIAQE